MLHYETVLRLKEADKETNSFGIIVDLEGEYGYGFVQKNNGFYEATTLQKKLEKAEILDNNEFKVKVKNLAMEDSLKEFWIRDIETAVKNILSEFRDLNKTVGGFTDLKNIADIVTCLERERLNFLIFREDYI